MRIGVLTEEPSNEDVAVALKEAGEQLGAEIVILDLDECAVVNTAKPEVLYQGKKLDGFDAILVRGSESKLEFRTHIVDYMMRTGVVVINSVDAIKNCDNKFLTQTILNAAGVKTPDTVSIVKIEQIDAAVHYLGNKFPMIVKTVSGSHGIGVIKVESFEGLKSVLQYLLAQKTDVMIQEFIAHKESGRIMILGDKVIASVMRSIPDGDFRSNMDQGAELSKHVATTKEVEVALKVAKTLGCVLSAIDYIIDPNGEMVVFEANSSPGLKGIQSVNEDIDIALEIMKFIIGHISKGVDGTETPVATVVDTTVHQDGDKDTDSAPDEVNLTVTSDVDQEASEEEEEVSTVSLSEKIVVKRINNDKPFDGKVDTGADRCSLHGEDIEIGDNYVRFNVGETRYKVALERFVTVLAANGSEKRPIVKFDITFNGNSFDGIEFNIADRSDMKFEVIIGQNLLAMAGVLINPQE
jgi:ribosomal protein S6--L-glutamate ligase